MFYSFSVHFSNVLELQSHSITSLNYVLDELESSVRELSANLVQQLACREELDFEQEQKDIFIARLNELHRRLECKRHLSMPSDGHLHMIKQKLSLRDDVCSKFDSTEDSFEFQISSTLNEINRSDQYISRMFFKFFYYKYLKYVGL